MLRPLLCLGALACCSEIVARDAIEWELCDAYSVYAPEPGELADRTRCGLLTVPRDYNDPTAGAMRITVVRVTARDTAHRRGAIILNPGGPGAPNGLEFAMTTQQSWDRHDDPLLVEAANTYDFIGFLPRGTGIVEPTALTPESEGALRCTSTRPDVPYEDPNEDRTQGNVARMHASAEFTAQTCESQPMSRYVDTEMTVRDIDAIREVLGESRISFYGVSYGTWLASWYAARYPDRIDRLVLDSAMNITQDFDVARLAQAPETQAIIDDLVIPLAISRPEVFGLGDSPDAVRATFEAMPHVLKKSVREFLEVQLAQGNVREAGFVLSMGNDIGRIASHHPEADADTLVDLAKNYYRHEAPPELGAFATFMVPNVVYPAYSLPTADTFDLGVSDSINEAVACNDTQAIRDPTYWTRKGDSYAALYRMASGGAMTHRPCMYWTRHAASRPSPGDYARIPRALILQTEHDSRTPLPGAMSTYGALPNAAMVVLPGTTGHGVIARGNACSFGKIGNYLIHDRLPEGLSECRGSAIGNERLERLVEQATRSPRSSRVR
ncbi:TAP-like protein [Luteibacter rhizovicinus]|uniref:TAP-like protein n=1 Tax=Luteibacter rhizovicinus TaxID=242606 RepID=A0A4R3YLC3_9GAMM|nr:alpha/beta fold hydrolase [Luteibacter rhizovicinus]TCV91603.1 TAP-like protein [Luteibacter rhizovicinus]